jgi:spore maturation protein CgeB
LIKKYIVDSLIKNKQLLGDNIMKILFITSGHEGIYSWFEAWIHAELKKKYEVKFFQCEKGFTTLKTDLESFKPEIALSLIGNFPTDSILWLKQQGIKTAVWLTEDPYFMDRTLPLIKHYDYMFTIDTAALEVYREKGHKQVYHLPLATNPEVFRPRQVEETFKSDICLVGYPYPDRVNFVKLLLRYTPYKIRIVGDWGNLLRKYKRYPNLSMKKGWVSPDLVANYYNGAKIVLNTHRPYNEKHNQNQSGIVGKSINNRTFDVAACAAFQIIEYKEGLSDHFEEEKEIVSFRSFEELVKKIHYYIQLDAIRNDIAIKARARVLKEHTFEHRLEKMVSIFEGINL